MFFALFWPGVVANSIKLRPLPFRAAAFCCCAAAQQHLAAGGQLTSNQRYGILIDFAAAPIDNDI